MAPPPIGRKEWPRIRYEYEETDKPNHEICAEHGISASTLTNRVRQWKWTKRRAPVPAEGPPLPQVEAPQPAAPGETAAPLRAEPSLHLQPAAQPGAPAADARQIARHLHGAIARVLAAIDTTLASVSGAAHPREIDRAGRSLAALTRTLQELNAMKAQYPAFDPEKDRGPDDPNEFALALHRKLLQFKAARGIA
jgi:hypothetical protein